MATRSLFLTLLTVSSLFSCEYINHKLSEREQKDARPAETQPESSSFIYDGECDFGQLLKDPDVSLQAKELVTDQFDYNTSADLKELFSSLENARSHQEKLFYFKAITKISDGSFSKELARASRKYIESHTKEFIAFFDEEGCITEGDLEAWADNTLLDFKTTGLLANGRYNPSSAERFVKQIRANCRKCPPHHSETLQKFAGILETHWDDYLASNGQ